MFKYVEIMRTGAATRLIFVIAVCIRNSGIQVLHNSRVGIVALPLANEAR